MIRYNEIDKHAAQWLRNLVAAGQLEQGEVDERPIQQLAGADLVGVTQFHTFAGIGGWPLALRLAGWPAGREVWTGSCPCQPFSVASPNRKGVADERHLWPAFRDLIAERRPATVFGEQVASTAGRDWLHGVSLDLEALGYRVGSADLCASGVGAPHIRQRLYWVAERIPNDERARRQWALSGRDGRPCQGGRAEPVGRCSADGMDDAAEPGRGRPGCSGGACHGEAQEPGRPGEARGGGLCDSERLRRGQASVHERGEDRQREEGGQPSSGRADDGARHEAGVGPCGLCDADKTGREFLGEQGPAGAEGPSRQDSHGQCHGHDGEGAHGGLCDAEYMGRSGLLRRRAGGEPADGRADHDPWWPAEIRRWADGSTRRIEPGTSPLAHGVPGRVGLLRAYGNAIVPQLAAQFVRAYMEAE